MGQLSPCLFLLPSVSSRVIFLCFIFSMFSFLNLINIILYQLITILLMKLHIFIFVHHLALYCSGHYFHHSFLPPPPFFLFFFCVFFSVATFSYRRSTRINKLIWQKFLRMPKKLWVDTFPDPVSHFGAPWWPFWILQAVQHCRW